jgi:hypothetical protein
MIPESIVVGLGLMSCDVVNDMPLGMLRVAGPIFKPLRVIYVTVFPGTQPDVMVITKLVSVDASTVAVALLAISTVGIADGSKNPIG